MEKLEFKDIQTIEQYREWNKLKCREWYKKNKARKQEYSRNYYYNVIKKSKEETKEQDI